MFDFKNEIVKVISNITNIEYAELNKYIERI